MSDRNYTEEELRAKEEAYREYLRLREEAPKVSITETPYGASQLRKKQKADERARAEYQKARESERRGRSPLRRSDKKSGQPARRSGSSGKEQTARQQRPSGNGQTAKQRAATGREQAKGKSRVPQPRRKNSGRSQYLDETPRPIAENPVITSEAARRKKEKGPGGPVKRKGLRRVILIVAALLVAFVALAAGGFAMVANTLSSIGALDMDKHNLAIGDAGKDALKDYKNIAVLGVDSRNMEDDTESRSDAMVIVSINKDTNEVKMFSVFRDTLLDLGGDYGLDKITHAYAYGGAELTVAALNRNLDLNISKAVVINWKTVAEVIDALGGIEIKVKESEIDELNKYVGGTAKATGSEKKKVKKAGKQTLNGAQAVTYARIRQDAVTGDYRRNERMKIVMATTFKKAKEADLLTLKQVCDNALPQAKTNLTTSEMIGLALKFKKLEMTSSTTGWPYDVEGWIGEAGGGSAWYGPPVTLESNVKKLFKKYFGISGYEPSVEVENISNNISELTGLY